MFDVVVIFVDYEIGGVFVVDEVGKCVGVFFLRDFVKLEKERELICLVGEFGLVYEFVVDLYGGIFLIEI